MLELRGKACFQRECPNGKGSDIVAALNGNGKGKGKKGKQGKGYHTGGYGKGKAIGIDR